MPETYDMMTDDQRLSNSNVRTYKHTSSYFAHGVFPSLHLSLTPKLTTLLIETIYLGIHHPTTMTQLVGN